MVHELGGIPYVVETFEGRVPDGDPPFHDVGHYNSSVRKLNTLIRDTEFADKSLDEIVCEAEGKILECAVQVWKQRVYWNSLSLYGGGRPEGTLAEAIDRDFGSYLRFQTKFNEATMGQRGSGWVCLSATRAGTLEIEATQNADTLLRRGKAVLLGCDLEEYSCYVECENAPADYMAVFWQLVNWNYATMQWDCAITSER